jgi:hypothetical protein
MSLKDSFCPSPWFHMRINNAGDYDYCRWAVKHTAKSFNIRNLTPEKFFQDNMSDIRTDLLKGNTPTGCADCQLMESHGKISGRQRQLLKTGVKLEYFDKSLISSPWADTFKETLTSDGKINLLPQDWQIDLGNFCNSACLFCHPSYSSKIATEWKRVGLLKSIPVGNWCEDDKNLKTFLDTLTASPKLGYLHFIGGETLITPAFKKILRALIDKNLAQEITIGFTTALTAWDESIIDLLTAFKQVNLGMSVECFHPVNDYTRYPSNINKVTETMHQWINVARTHGWLVQLRTTPTILTIKHLVTVFEFAYNNDIAVESCNFLDHPAYMRPTVLPKDYRLEVIALLEIWLKDKTKSDNVVVNIRDPNQAKPQVVQDAQSYLNYLKNQADESHLLPELINYLKIMESSRNNSVLTYLPEYEQLFRSAGY